MTLATPSPPNWNALRLGWDQHTELVDTISRCVAVGRPPPRMTGSKLRGPRVARHALIRA